MSGEYGESKNKLGDRGKISGEKTFNTESGVQSSGGQNSPQTSWQGKTNGGKNKEESD